MTNDAIREILENLEKAESSSLDALIEMRKLRTTLLMELLENE